MQVANYPSLLRDPGPNNLRKKAHIDSGTLTLLASEDWLPGSSWQAGDGGLQLLSPQQEWLEVQVPPGVSRGPRALLCVGACACLLVVASGSSLFSLQHQQQHGGSGGRQWQQHRPAVQHPRSDLHWKQSCCVAVYTIRWSSESTHMYICCSITSCTPMLLFTSWLLLLLHCCSAGALLVNLGSLMSRWTNTLWKSTLHRVTNPPAHKQANSRRLSMAFFHKPAYDALLEVLPTCYSSASDQRPTKNSAGQVLPESPQHPAAVVGDLTRQGILHKYKHLPPEEASRMYHAHLASLRKANSVH